MTKNRLFLFLSFSLVLLVPFPGRFAFGITELIILNLLVFFSILFARMCSSLEMENIKGIFMLSFSVGITVIFQQLLKMVCPYIALCTGYITFIPCISSFYIGFVKNEKDMSLNEELKSKLSTMAVFSGIALVFFLIRDIFGYGTITLTVHNGLFELVVFPDILSSTPGTFLATVPGALVMVSIFVAFAGFVQKKMSGEESK